MKKSSKHVIWEKCFGMYGSICIPHAGNSYSQSDNNSRSKHEKWDKRQHPKKDQISQLQFYPFQNSKLKLTVELILAILPFSRKKLATAAQGLEEG